MSEWLPRDIFRPVSEAEREAVRTAQRALNLDVTGEMDAATQAGLRGVQYVFGLPVTGCLDRATAERLDRLRPPSLKE
ncbi:peptidoglycan-binding domain-containing protein [Streptomyces halobius]|uniref:Peptidoglycan-binding protein n=1 Tax=Streptomyces halobius TaxID=2879846 RepID=A0ABY4M1J5_9ACTN|nr:peptidoglycan-binding domain-containing protein [Streptomyces halobius]UQA91626.1 peptidoglycan-binding protein [Streptomyces halobius]